MIEEILLGLKEPLMIRQCQVGSKTLDFEAVFQTKEANLTSRT